MKKYLFRLNSITFVVLFLLCYACQAQTAHTVKNSWPLKGGIAGTNGITVTGYKIYRSTTSGAEAAPALATITDVNVLSYVDSAVTAGTTYFYTYSLVLSCDTTVWDCSKFPGESLMSAEVSPGKIPLPTAPTVGQPAAFTAVIQ